ncbi:phosphotransferase [Brevibacillus sp. FSL K6-6036]|uniref:phosphotransferase family protein n=1 Tax=Brevibacillus sp. FSL K6-6036 TaxID=2954682 RepID=UPI0030D38A40
METDREPLVNRSVEAIRRSCPDLPITSAVPINLGQNNDVLLVNDELIFRFPKYAEGIRKLRLEVRILEKIQSRVSLDVPCPLYHCLDSNQVGRAFAGYKRIGGEPLWKRLIHAENAPRLAGQLSRFLDKLHNLTVDVLDIDGLGAENGAAVWSDLYERIREKLFPFMRLDAQKWVEQHFETFLQDETNFATQPVLIHGDVGPGNILYDKNDDRITGIIDFGSSGLGDPAIDYAGLIASYGEPFFNELLRHSPDIEAHWTRAKFYRGTFALQEALFGLENNDQAAFQNGIKGYT